MALLLIFASSECRQRARKTVTTACFRSKIFSSWTFLTAILGHSSRAMSLAFISHKISKIYLYYAINSSLASFAIIPIRMQLVM